MPLAAGFGDGSGVRNSKTRLNLHQSSRGVIVRRVNPLPASPKVARAWQPLGCGPKSRWDLKAAQGAALVVVALSGWCVFTEDAGPTGLKILFCLGGYNDAAPLALESRATRVGNLAALCRA
jgi:hypothetical protein